MFFVDFFLFIGEIESWGRRTSMYWKQDGIQIISSLWICAMKPKEQKLSHHPNSTSVYYISTQVPSEKKRATDKT